MALGILILRVVLGAVMAAHGAQKLFGWFGGHGLAGTAGWLESMGFQPGKIHAALTGGAEFGGGVLFALGLLTPLASAAIIGVMVVAIVTVHWSKGLFAGNGGYELNLAFITAAIAVALTGPGRYSVDHALGWGFNNDLWALFVAVAGILAAGATLAVRSSRSQERAAASTT